jgi:membrane-associated phospholipid phosphatase
VSDLHAHPPMTLTRVHARAGWLLTVALGLFALLAVGAAFDALPWVQPIHDAVLELRTSSRNDVALAVSRFGSTPVVLTVAAALALVAWPRCRSLAVAIVLLALARPLVEFGLKELVDRERPVGDRLVNGRGPSFPSGHPFAAAASWGFVPLVVALYTRRRRLWWASVVGAWTLIVLVAVSRVWLGVHWASDVVGGVLVAVLGILGSERFIAVLHDRRGQPPCGQASLTQPDLAARPGS